MSPACHCTLLWKHAASQMAEFLQLEKSGLLKLQGKQHYLISHYKKIGNAGVKIRQYTVPVTKKQQGKKVTELFSDPDKGT